MKKITKIFGALISSSAAIATPLMVVSCSKKKTNYTNAQADWAFYKGIAATKYNTADDTKKAALKIPYEALKTAADGLDAAKDKDDNAKNIAAEAYWTAKKAFKNL